ncbi:hypothetical protein COCON_G00185970 [Conger conger]|uniref:THAP-type domain-containing protein n=1 Tax=Conger conger TaxID=82655 RepID=A0A9Q1HRN2_CONCO|nr:hypothetical protein COCON_G00185970 [Conger conger]
MVSFCAVVGCSNRADRERDKSFFRLPKTIRHQGEQTLRFSEERRAKWISWISRQDLTPKKMEHIRICSDHFVTGQPSKLYMKTDIDWVPSKLRGHQKIDVKGLQEGNTRIGGRKRKMPLLPLKDEIFEIVIKEENVEAPCSEQQFIEVYEDTTFKNVSDHFVSGQPSKLYMKTDIDWLPSKLLGHQKIDVKGLQEGNTRIGGRKRKIPLLPLKDEIFEIVIKEENVEAPCSEQQFIEVYEDTTFTNVSCQTELTSRDISSMEDDLSL